LRALLDDRLDVERERIQIIVTGTDPEQPKGGIGVAIPAFLHALRRSGLPTVFIPTYRAGDLPGKFVPWLRAIPRVLREVRSARRMRRIPVVYAHAGAGPSMLREGLLLRLARVAGARTVMQLHSQRVDDWLSSAWRIRVFRFFTNAADRLFVLTPWWLERVAPHTPKPVSVVPNPLAEAIEQVASRAGADPSGAPVQGCHVVTMARLVSGKGQDLVIQALASLPESIVLTVAGTGPTLAPLRALTERLGLSDRVSFAGWVDGSHKDELLARADIFCLPSVHDSFGLGYVEAMAHGVPVIGVRSGAVSDVVPDGVAGMLLGTPTAAEVASAIVQMQDVEVRRRMGAAGKAWVLRRFGSRVVSEMLAAAFERVARSKS
jgi:glycosyltransferase involved in cell wall biosynthesis